MEAIGITSKGKLKKFIVDDYGFLNCVNKDLVSLDIPNDVKILWCCNNKLTSINLPKSIIVLDCSNNQLTKLNLHKELERIYCDKHIKGLEKYIDGECEIILV